MANERELAGDWSHRFGLTQEDALCYSTTLYSTLRDQQGVYPWPANGIRNSGNVQGLFIPGVGVFKGLLIRGCEARDLPENERRVISIVSVAAPKLHHSS
jgi:hypothetical protein